MTYGDGSSGALNVASGTHNLALNTKHQFTSVNIAAGATLSTSSTTGSVLYILCQGTFTLDGNLNVSNKVNHGNNTWSVTIDGTTYTSPGVADGGTGTWFFSVNNKADSVAGFGSGGAGAGLTVDFVNQPGGDGGMGAASGAAGGARATSTRSTAGDSYSRNHASVIRGGSGLAWTRLSNISGGTANVTATSGRGGQTHGANGENGVSGGHSGTGSYAWNWFAGGGGGAGGRAGRAGVHVVIKARDIIINGSIITSGTNGQKGGNGGRNRNSNGFTSFYGLGGGGGGGGNGGDVFLTYSDYNFTSTDPVLSGGTGGAGGLGHSNLGLTANSGSNGTSGSLSVNTTIIAEGSAGGGSTVEMQSESYSANISSGGSAYGKAASISIFQPLLQKDYEYRVFDSDGFLSVWQNVLSDFNYDQKINQTASELKVRLGRAPDNRTVKYEALRDDQNEVILDDNSDQILVQTESANAVGPETDVDLNLNVDVYAFYGGYEQIIDEFGEPILDEFNDPILAQYGHPNGLRVYSGYIADYTLTYGEKTGVDVVIVPHSTEMDHYPYKDDLSWRVHYASEDPVVMAQEAIDYYKNEGGLIDYSTATMSLSGEDVNYTFQVQTIKDVIDKSVDLLPSGWYHYPHPGENMQYLLPKSETADHVFYYEKHVGTLQLRKSITQLINKVAFVGGVAENAPEGTKDLFIYREDATSIGNYRNGLEIMSDARVSVTASAEILADRKIEEYKEPRYRTVISINDKVYDIESIKLGQMVAFKNFGTFVDGLLLQIVGINRREHTVSLELDMTVPNESKRLSEIKKQLRAEGLRNINDTPS